MDNSDEPEDLLDGKIVFQKNKDRTFSKTKVICTLCEKTLSFHRSNTRLTPGSHRTRKRRGSEALITAEVCDIISNARRFGVATASGVTSQAPARQGLALTPRFGVAPASGVNPA
ncbi:unnamed protein product [Pleuronectes platessa]|uniref:Uncharacterized protein n=1 Tax=Pleuronectes platessa TaxID=8262 RepID=A0A9N7UH46_PLEPL|nr:unnamed protein product [Pleuronectes platessa]